MIRGIDYITIEVHGLNQSGMADLDECQGLLDENPKFKNFITKALRHRTESGYIDIALYPKDGDKRKFIEDIKKLGI